MATQFDAVARLSVDIRGFATAASQMTSQGGAMQKVFRDLHAVLNQVDIVEKNLAADLRRSLGVYSSMGSAITKISAAFKALAADETGSAKGAAAMVKALESMKAALATVTPMGEKEFQRLQRTLTLYNQMTGAIAKNNQASATAAKAVRDTEQAYQRQQQAQVNLLTSQQRLVSAQNQAQASQVRLNTALERQRQLTEQATQANNRMGSSFGTMNRGSLGLRSDLSEIEQLYKTLAKDITASATASINAAISHEAAFAQVIRVTQETGEGAKAMRNEFEKLTTQLPVSFEELAKIGQLAAQTGVANDQLVQFSRTVVQFSVTTGIASDQVTVLFARIADMLNLPTNQMNNFASMILKLGTISAATELEILKVNQSIASAGRAFGLSTEEIGGLSGALASLRIPPEWARGSMTRILRDLDNASNDAGMGMNVLVEVMGKSADEITKMRNTDPGGFLMEFTKGMQKYTREGQLAAGTTRTITDVMGDLGITSVRDIDFITRLANNFSTLKTQTDEAFLEFARGNELTKQTEIIFGTTRQNIDNLKDAFQTFLATAGQPFADLFGTLAPIMTKTIEAFKDFGDTGKGIMGFLIGMMSIAGALAAGIALYRVALIKAARGALAFTQLQRQMNGEAVTARNVMRLYREEQANTQRELANTAVAQQRQSQALAASRSTMIANVRATQQAEFAQAGYAQSLRAAVAATGGQAGAQAQQIVRQQQVARGAEQARIQTVSLFEANRRLTPSIVSLAEAHRRGAINTNESNTAYRAQVGLQRAIAGNSSQLTAATFNYAAAQREAGARAAQAATSVQTSGVAARVASAAFIGATGAVSLFKVALTSIGIGLVITGLTALYQAVTRSNTAIRDAAKAGFDAAGGQTAFGQAVRKDQEAIAKGATVVATMTATTKDLDAAQRSNIESRRNAAMQEQTFIEAMKGSIETLRSQAQGTGDSAKEAQGFVKRWDAAKSVIDQMTAALKGNKIELSDTTQALGSVSVQQAVMADKSSKNLKALELLKAFGPGLRQAMSLMFSDPTKAAQILQDEIDKTNQKILNIKSPVSDVTGNRSARRLFTDEQKDEIKTLEDYAKQLGIVSANMKLNEQAVRGGALADEAFGKAAKDAGAGADAMANGMDSASDSADGLTQTADQLAARTEKLASAFGSIGDFSTAMSTALEKAKARQEAQAAAQEAGSQKAEKLRDAQEKLNNTLNDIKTDKMEKAREIQQKLNDAIADAGGNSAKVATANQNYARSMRDLEADTSKTTKAQGDYASAIKDAGDEAEKASKKTQEITISLRDWMAELEVIAQARMQRATNLIKLAGRVPADVMQELEGLGPEFSGVIQEMVDSSDEDLKKMFPVMRMGGEGSKNAFAAGLAGLQPLVAGKGKAAGEELATEWAKAVDEATATGGSIPKALENLRLAVIASNKLKIPLSVEVDLMKTKGDVEKVNKVIDDAVASGKLTAEASVTLKTQLFQDALTRVQAQVKELDDLKIESSATMNVEQWDRNRQRLIDDGTVTTLKNLLGIKGLAELDPEGYKNALNLLHKLGVDTTKNGDLNVSGKATLQDEEFWTGERNLRQLVKEGVRMSAYNPKGTATLDPKPFNDTLYDSNNGVINASFRAGLQISRNLSTTATVTVGYTYKNNNAPPDINRYQNIATGGWVSGPGGPKDDRVRAMLSNGEFVVNAKAAAKYGSLLQSINDYGLGGPRGLNIPAISGDPMATGRIARSRRAVGQTMQTRQYQDMRVEPRTVITVNNAYPQAEPTSITVNRALAYAAMLDGTI